MATDPGSAGSGSGSTKDRADELLFECLELAATEGVQALEAMCEEHPEHAEALREGFDRLVTMGLVPGDTPNRPPDFPERLGEFRLIRKIGGGGMGVVYLAEQESESRRVALKVIRPDRVYYKKEVARFRREVEAIARLRHPGIVSVFAVGQDRDIPFFAMEWLEGATLYEVLRCFDGRRAEDLSGKDLWRAVCGLRAREEKKQDEGEEDSEEIPDLFHGSWCQVCLRIAREIAEVLHFSHKRGIIHRDIKPSNLWITPAGRIVLIDFGLARTRESSELTVTGAQLGSLLYMSPEQVLGSSGIDERTDVYSLGVTLYESLAFRSPFDADSTEVTVRRIVQGDTRAPRAWNPAIPRAAQTVCMKAMSRRVHDRYRSAGAFSHDLSNVLAGRPIDARRPSWVVRSRDWTERHPAGAVGLLLLASLVFFAFFTAMRERSALRRIQLLADSRWIERLTLEARSFWPMDPGKLETMDDWLSQVAEVRGQHEIHEEELAAIRERALPYSEEEARRDRAPTERILSGLRSELRVLERLFTEAEDREAFLARNGGELKELRQFIGELESRDTRSTWSFADRSDEWRHEMLTRLIETEYDAIVALEKKVRNHQDDIRRIHRLSILEREDDWNRAIADIAALPVYGGLQLTPQMGLRPLRRNPASGLWEFLHVPSGVEPRPDPTEEDPGRLAIDEGSGIVLVLIPGGVARVGARPSEGELDFPVSVLSMQWERPVHEIELDPFFLSKYEMTLAQFARLGGSLAPNEKPSRFPVTPTRTAVLETFDRTWLELPTEAQWEYACRAGTETAFYTGDTLASLVGHANLGDRSFRESEGEPPGDMFDDGFVDLAPVGSFLPNGFGLHDVHGNAQEWTADVFINRAYSTMEARPGDGLRFFARDWAEGLRYGTRGGGHWSPPGGARSAFRRGDMPEVQWQTPGVRPMRRVW